MKECSCYSYPDGCDKDTYNNCQVIGPLENEIAALKNELQTANHAIEKLQSQLHQCREREKYLKGALKVIRDYAKEHDFLLNMDAIVSACDDALDSEGVE